jgi:hypothetical protein
VTTAARTFLDVAPLLPTSISERLLEEWLADRKTTVAEVRRSIEHYGGRGRRGTLAARTILENRVLGDEPGDSTDEHVLLRALAEYGIALPETHVVVRDRYGDVITEVDHAYLPLKLALELHGFTVKTRHRRTFEHMLEVMNRMQEEGWEVKHYTPAQVVSRPWRVCREIEEARHRRALVMGVSLRTGDVFPA